MKSLRTNSNRGLMMIIRRHIKLISAFLGINFLSSLIAPNVAHALTSGPTAPEFTSFEPVDTTDLVNIVSGDFVYNLPLLEVPGPAGSFPLALSYHAGIRPQEEASWVGLGWTLNPGAITRSLNGFPDDYANAYVKVNDYWSGGTRKDYQIAIPVGPFGVDFHVSKDTYKGFNFEGMGLSAGMIGAGIRLGSDGNLSARTGGLLRHNYNFNVRTRKASYQPKVAVDVAGIAALVSNLDLSKQAKASVSTGISIYNTGQLVSSNVSSLKGTTNKVHNNNGGNISTSSKGINLKVFSFNRTRYWIDQDDISYASGVFNAHQVDKNISTGATIAKSSIINTKTFDRALLGNPLLTDTDFDDEFYYEGMGSSRDLSSGPSVLAKDGYQVLGQGISGMIEPYSLDNLTLFEKKIIDRKHLYSSNFKNVDIENQIYNVSSNSLPFRFKGDFSNSYQVTPNAETYFDSQVISPDEFGYTYSTGKNYTPGIVDPNGVTANRVAGSKDVKTYTTQDLNSYNSRFDLAIDYKGSLKTNHNSVGSYDVEKQIGAFKITKEDGITYHYTKALYSYDYENKSFDKTQGTTIRTLENKQPYAYAWLLTGMTGPDYVDRGLDVDISTPNGVLDDNDWGYWVAFAYGEDDSGKDYGWRFPFSGYDGDLQGSHSYSAGKRQNAYLKAIYTKTNTALFITGARSDARAAHVNGGIDTGSELRYRLSDILLLDNELLNTSSSIAESIQNLSKGSGGDLDLLTSSDISRFNADHGIDLFQNHLKRIQLNHDYSLVPHTENSGSQGKLTLNQLNFLHKGSTTSIIPPVTFEYELGEQFKTVPMVKKVLTLTGGPTYESKITVDSNALEVGDLIEVLQAGQTSYYYVKHRITSTKYGVNAFYNSFGTVLNESVTVDYRKTKNPPAPQDYHDAWGYFKSDYKNLDDDHQNMDFYKQTTELSSKATDVWSLRKIYSPLGGAVEMEYESDDFVHDGIDSKRIVNFKPGYRVKFQEPDGDIVWLGADNLWNSDDEFEFSREIYFGVKNGDYNLVQPVEIRFDIREVDGGSLLSKAFDVGDNIDIQFNRKKRNSSVFVDGPVKLSFTIKDISNDLEVTPNSNEFDTYLTELLAKSVYTNSHYLLNLFSFTSFTLPVNYGGGLRTKAINTLSESGEKISSIDYTYADGVTAYTPFFDKQLYLPTYDEIAPYQTGFHYRYWNQYENEYQKLFNQHAQIVDILPSPGVTYGNVASHGYNGNNLHPTYQEQEFITYDPSMTVFSEAASAYSYSGGPINQASVNYILKDKSSMVGLLRSSSIKRTDNDELLFFAENTYKSADQLANTQGMYEEITNEHRRIHDGEFVGNTNSYVHQAITTRLAQLPTVLVKSTKQDFTLGTSSVTQNLGHDFYSGAVTVSYNEDSYGNKYVNKSVPAYHYYDEMGLMLNGGMNMLTQNGTNYSYLMDPGFDPDAYTYQSDLLSDPNGAIGVVAASAQTWSKDTEVLNYTPSPPISASIEWNGGASSLALVIQEDVLEDGELIEFIATSLNPAKTFLFEINGVWNAQADGYLVNDYHNVGAQNMSGFVKMSPNTYRQHKSHSYIGLPTSTINSGGTMLASDFSEPAFAPINVSEAAGWQKNSEITLYDVNSHALEAMDVNENYAATKFDLENQRVIATVANARFDEFTGSSFDNLTSGTLFNGGVKGTTGGTAYVLQSGISHTGEYGLQFRTSSPDGRIYFEPDPHKIDPVGKYVLFAWLHGTQADVDQVTAYKNVNGVSSTITWESGYPKLMNNSPSESPGGMWFLVKASISLTGSISTLEVGFKGNGGQVTLDDFRFHPVDATMTSYAYNEWGELSDILDANNLNTHYEYDETGRLKSVSHETLRYGPVKVSEVEFFYGKN